MAIFGLDNTSIAFLALMLGSLGALVTPLTIFLIRVGRDIDVIKNTLQSHNITIESHNENAEEDKKVLNKLVTDVEVLKSKIYYLESGQTASYRQPIKPELEDEYKREYERREKNKDTYRRPDS